MPFLPIKNTHTPVDFVLISADAYVDHPSFGHAVISRITESLGFTIGIVAQPLKDEDYKEFGRPNYGFLVSGGVVDSMVNNYTVALKRRTRDEYSPGGALGRRPDRAVTVYTRRLKMLFPDCPVIIGGVEASLRRFAHYDYWSDKVMPSVLLDSGADLMIYGMGEKPLTELLALARRGVPVESIKDVKGTAYISDYNSLSESIRNAMSSGNVKFCPTLEEVISDKLKYVKAFNIQHNNSDITLAQKHGDRYVVCNPVAEPLSVEEMDRVYALPYMRTYHPSYTEGVPAIQEVSFSITSHRGCFGNCNYCSINYHQGNIIQKRSKASILKEAELLTKMPDFKGYIHDVGGPTADFRIPACKLQADKNKTCGGNCIGWEPCRNLEADHSEYLDLLRSVRAIPNIKKVFIRSGIRYDYVMYDPSGEFLREIINNHVSGQLKVAPEHISDRVLQAMNKPSFKLYKQFKEKFDSINREEGLKQYLVPYFISSHPGSSLSDAIELALYFNSEGHMPEQVQDFYPTPSTKSTTMYYTGINPDTMAELYVPKTREEKSMQRALMQYKLPQNYRLVKAALIKAGRGDLIGNGSEYLIRPYSPDVRDGRSDSNISNDSKASYASNVPKMSRSNAAKVHTKSNKSNKQGGKKNG